MRPLRRFDQRYGASMLSPWCGRFNSFVVWNQQPKAFQAAWFAGPEVQLDGSTFDI